MLIYPNIGKILARSGFGLILKGKRERRRTFYALKNTLPYNELCNSADYFERYFPEKFKQLMFGNGLPKSYRELGVSEASNVTDDPIKEINWTLLAVRKHAYKISLFLNYKEIYEESLLTGDYEKAEKYLSKIEEEICYSIWTLENRFLLKEYSESGTENKEFLAEFNKQNESDGYVKSLAHFLSIRAERNLSVNRFNIELNNSLNRMTGFSKDEHKEFYLFRLSFLNHNNFSKYAEILCYDFKHSVIDRYINLRKVFISLLTTVNYKEGNQQKRDDVKDYILSRLTYLHKKVQDPLLDKLKVLADKNVRLEIDKSEEENVSLIDKYTAGLYQEVEEYLESQLLKKPLDFDKYDLYVKSLAYQNKEYQFIGKSNSIQNQILMDMYNIISVKGNRNEYNINLLRIANNITSCQLSYGIIDFVSHHIKGQSERKMLARLSFSRSNPIIYDCFPTKELQVAYLTELKKIFKDSLSINFLLCKNTDVDGLTRFQDIIPDVKFRTELAIANQKKGNFIIAVEMWEKIISEFKSTLPVLETAIRNIFICYENLKRFDDCVNVYVNSFFMNNHIIEKVNVTTFLQKVKTNRFKDVRACIELPIFYTIVNADENEMHIAYEKFNLSQGITKPSELLNRYVTYENSKILFYLKYVCNPEIFKHSIHISGTTERLEERLNICQYLIEKDFEDKEFYNQEIKNISNILIIQKGLHDLDESKIYVNEQGIITNELKDYEAIYTRFTNIAKLVEKNKVLFLDTESGTFTTLQYSDDGVESKKLKYSDNPAYDIYKELFDGIKDKFLNSKFGIVAYLSTRIRHGVLLGEIRPVFEKHQLITQKDGNTSTYRRNVFWDERFMQENNIVKDKIQSLLSDFSYKIDGLIFDLIKKYLQVKDSLKNPDGWFDFDFEETELLLHSIKSTKTIKNKDFTQFVKEVFEILWYRTDQNLELIRKNIDKDISQMFNNEFDKLEKEIVGLISQQNDHGITTTIKSCSTETLTVLKRITNWFKRSGTHTSDFNLNNLIDIVFEHSNKSYPNKRINLTREINFDCLIKGEYYSHFVDLFRIFLENILKHSNEKASIIEAKITCDVTDERMRIIIENKITDNSSIESLNEAWSGEVIDVTKLVDEGKSGYHKANKILRLDLKNEKNQFSNMIVDDCFRIIMLIHHKELLT